MDKNNTLWSGLRSIHIFCMTLGVYPMLLSSMLCLGLVAGRFYYSRSWTFYFLLWNLTLAWVPYVSAMWAYMLHQAKRKQWLRILPVALLSIVFFPNAPYIVTDFLHLAARPPVPLWYDIGMLAAFAWAGILLGVYALRLLHGIVEDWVGRWVGWGFVMVTILLSGFGVYLGRFLRWNSWDLLTNPTEILTDIAVRFRHPFDNLQTFGVAFLFASLLFTCYTALTGLPGGQKTQKLARSKGSRV